MPIIEIVRLREDEVYKATGKFRISYNGLLRLAAAAAFEWSAIDTCRTDGRTDKMYCSFRAVGGVRKADGRIYFHKAEKDIDLEVIEMELEEQYSNNWDKIGDKPTDNWKKHGHKTKKIFVAAMVRRDLIQKRKNKLTLVESGAKARVIRFVLGLQGQYANKDDLFKTKFVMVHYALNARHPDVKGALTKALPDAMTMVYGGVKDTGQIPYTGPTESEPEEVIDIPSDPVPEEKGKGRAFAPAQASPEDGNLVDFQNIPVDEQVEILEKLCVKAGQDFKHYTKESKVGIDKVDQDWRDDFFVFLKGEME